LEATSKYTFVPLPSIKCDPFICQTLRFSQTHEPSEQLSVHVYPYETVPDLECHIAPPFAAINGGPKCTGTDLDTITLDYCPSSDSRRALKHRLELLCEIWELFQNAKEDANKWERGMKGKRKREQEDEDIERLTQSSRRTARSQSRMSQDPTGDNTIVMHPSQAGSRKRKAASSLRLTTLTKRAVSHLSKRQKTSDFHMKIKYWAESIHN
jgi:hypothetical protein